MQHQSNSLGSAISTILHLQLVNIKGSGIQTIGGKTDCVPWKLA